MSSYQLRICYLYGENNNMGCEKIVNKMSGAAMSAGRLGTATVQPIGMTTQALVAKTTDRPTGNPPGAPD